MGYAKVRVSKRTLLNPGMVRVTFAGDGVVAFEDSGVPDEFVRVFFPDAETGDLPEPTPDEAGRAIFGEGVKEPHNEYYTIRRLDRTKQELDIDFVVHEGGRASEWAQTAEPGDAVILSKARFCYEPPKEIDWQLLLADATALPALGRILEETPETIRTTAVIEIAHASHKQALREADHITIHWIIGSGNGVGPSNLLANVKVRSLDTGNGYVWMSGEMFAARAIRRYLRNDLKLKGENFDCIRYWVDNKEDWRARWDALDPKVKADLDKMWESDLDPEEKADIWSNTLDQYGL